LIGLLADKIQRTKGVGLLVTSRTQPPAPFEPYRLEPLELASTRQLLEGELGVAPPKEATDWMFERSRGNPLFALEHLRYLVRGGYLWSDGQRWNWRAPLQGLLPVTVEALIERLIADIRQQPGAMAALEARAILPWQVEPQVWAEVAGLPEAEFASARRELERRGLLRSEAFAHPLFKEVTERTLLPERRRALALNALTALQSDAVAAAAFVEQAAIAPHHAQQVLSQAVQQSQQHKNPVMAARLLGQIVAYTEGPQQAEAALKAAQALKTVDVIEAARLALLAESTELYRIPARYLRAELEAIQGRLKEAERLLMALQGEGDYSARLLKLRGSAMDYSGVLEVLATHPEVLHQPDAETAHRAARALAQNGQIPQAKAIVKQALAQANLSPADQALLLRASSQIALMQSDYAAAEALEAQIQTLAQGLGNLRLLDQALFNRALALEGLGRYSECLDQLGAAMEVCRELGDRTAFVIAQVAYARHLFEFAEYERAEGLLLEGRDHLCALDPSVYLLDCQIALCTLYREWPSSHGVLLALKHARMALEAAQQIKNPRNTVAALHALALAEAKPNPEQAQRWAEQAQAVADNLKIEEASFLALQARAVALEALQRPQEALDLFRQAQSLSPAAGSPMEYHKLGLKIAQLSHDPALAQQHLSWLEERGLMHAVGLGLRWIPQVQGKAGIDKGKATSFSLLTPASPFSLPTTSLDVLGPMCISQNGCSQTVRGPKRQELLALLLEARLTGRGEIGRLELLDLLYPGIDEAQAASALKSTVHVIRASFGQNLIQTSPQGYALGPVTSDVEAFLDSGDTGLWRGVYLEGIAIERSENILTELQQALLAGLSQATGVALRHGKTLTGEAEQIRLSKLLLNMDPYNLEGWRALLRGLHRSQNYRSLSRSYAECRERLGEVGETLPERWQEFVL
jgi:tetratricopeptide (TPR) repeat protein